MVNCLIWNKETPFLFSIIAKDKTAVKIHRQSRGNTCTCICYIKQSSLSPSLLLFFTYSVPLALGSVHTKQHSTESAEQPLLQQLRWALWTQWELEPRGIQNSYKTHNAVWSTFLWLIASVKHMYKVCSVPMYSPVFLSSCAIPSYFYSISDKSSSSFCLTYNPSSDDVSLRNIFRLLTFVNYKEPTGIPWYYSMQYVLLFMTCPCRADYGLFSIITGCY